jgi:Zn-dependent protease
MGSLKLITIKRIPIRVHITFPLILIWAAVQFGIVQRNGWWGALFGIVVTLLLFLCVVLHELAHSLFALQFGGRVNEIVLLPLGGVAQMERIPDRPYQELLMALAGPVTSGIIGIALAFLTLFLFPLRIWTDFLRALSSGGDLSWSYLLPYLAITNLFLAGFNLLPAFPMDGGRVLRAVLATVMPYSRATALAVRVGQGLAWMLGLLGLFTRDVLLILVALFVYTGATQEGRLVQMKTALAGLRVRQAYSHSPRVVHPEEPLGHADEGRLVGVLTRTGVLQGLKEYGPQVPIRDVMQRRFLIASPEDDLFDVQQRMSEVGAEVVPVVDAGTFLGLLTRQDLEEAYRLVTAYPALLPRRR